MWGLGIWGREGRDVGTSSMGRGDVWDGDAGMSNIGTREVKSEVNAISLSSRKCVIYGQH